MGVFISWMVIHLPVVRADDWAVFGVNDVEGALRVCRLQPCSVIAIRRVSNGGIF